MALPQQKHMEVPLLLELERAGGQVSAKSRIYDAVARHFPDLAPGDRTRTRASTGVNEWENNVQWARNRLRVKGELNGGVRGVWGITRHGRERLRQELARLGISNTDMEAFINSPQTIPDKVGSRWRPEALTPRARKRVPPPEKPEQPPIEISPPPEEEEGSADIETRLLERVRSLTPREFELLIREYLWSYGFENVQVTSTTRDGGIDGTFDVPIAELRLGFQAKRWSQGSTVGGPLIRDFRGALVGRGLPAGILITTSEFTAGAEEEAEQAGPRITLINGKALADNLVERGIGIKDVVVEAELDEDFFRGLGE